MQFNDNFPFITDFRVDSKILNKFVGFGMHTYVSPNPGGGEIFRARPDRP
jgi:hypothetical protein